MNRSKMFAVAYPLDESSKRGIMDVRSVTVPLVVGSLDKPILFGREPPGLGVLWGGSFLFGGREVTQKDGIRDYFKILTYTLGV